jgi:DNA-binding protein H-NS
MENDSAKKPTIDERLQALAQSLELLTTLHRDLEQQTAARFADTAARFADLGQFINQLAHIA